MRRYLFDPSHQALIDSLTKSSDRFKPLRQGLLWIGIVGFGIFMSVLFMNSLQVLLNGTSTEAEIIGQSPGSKGAVHITYRYRVNDTIYTNSADMSRETYESLFSLRVPVVYARHNPSISFLEPVSVPQTLFVGAWAIGLIGSAIGSFWTGLRDLTRPDKHRLIPGTLLNIGTSQAPSGALWRIEYEFISPRGKRIMGSYAHRATSPDMPSPGVILAILYQGESVHHPL